MSVLGEVQVRIQARPLLHRWLDVRWLRMAWAMGMLLLAYGCWQVFQWTSAHRPLVGNIWFAAFALAHTVAAAGAARRCPPRSRLRSAWRMIALGAGAYLLGDVAWAGYELAGKSPYPSVADGLSLMFYPLMLWGLLRLPTPRRTVAERIRITIDLAVVAIGGFAVVVYVVLGPTIVQSGPDGLQTAFSIAYPVGDLVLLVGLGSVLLRGTSASSAVALRFIAAGLGFFVAADLCYGYITLNSTYAGGDPVDTVYVIAMALFAIAGSAQARPPAVPDSRVAVARQRASWAPLIAVALGFGLMLYSERADRLLPTYCLVVAAVALALLVSIRQFLAQRDLLDTQVRLAHRSLHDALTELPNRVLVLDRAEQMLARGRRQGSTVAAMYIDIDDFKHVNDTFGHATGDELLRVVAARLDETVRQTDTVGRLGGDEFIVLLDNSDLDAGPELVAERLMDVLSQPIELRAAGGRRLSITASIGIAVGQHETADLLIRDADFALYEAKGAGKNQWAVFQSEMQTAARDRMALEMDLKRTVDEGQLFLLYQPIFDLRNETITGVEALVRWRHPVHGVVSPAVFIPLAEETGLIVRIGAWVLRAACEQALSWRHRGAQLNISVNVSTRQLEQAGFVDQVAEILDETGIDPTALTLEITETALMRDPDAAATRLHGLKALGVRIAIDDFGIGYSSLAYLRQFPVDELKIDRSFTAGIASSDGSQALIHTLVQLSKAMGLETVAEGIEQDMQLRQLQRERCDSGQGFLLARPMEPDAIAQLIGAGAAAAVAGATEPATRH